MEMNDGQGTTKATEMQSDNTLNHFFEEQLQAWPDAKQRFNALKGCYLSISRLSSH